MEPETGIAYLPMALKSIVDKSKPDDPGRFFSGTLSSCEVDLEGEIFDPQGIDTKVFKSAGGPIFVPPHNRESTASGECAVVARVLSMSNTSEGLLIHKAVFDTDLLSEHWKGKVERGFIKCMSAGMIRQDYEYQQRGGKQIRVVKKAVLIHGILTAQPVNRGSLIASKSLERIESLERQIEVLKTSSVPAERFQELADSIKAMSEQLQTVSDGMQVHRTSDPPAPDPLGPVVQAVAAMAVEAYKAANPGLPVAAFLVEKGFAMGPDGRVSRRHCHLPHHDSMVANGLEHSTVNKSMLKHALALVERVKPATEEAAEFQRRASIHLRAHAAALGIAKE